MQCKLLTHKIRGHFTHAFAEDEVLHDVWDESEGHTEETQHEITDSQREQEQIGDCPHPPVPHEHGNDQTVPDETHQKDDDIQRNPHCLVHI